MDKLKALTKYQSDLKDRLSNPTPEKHKNNPKTYKNFLDNELRLVNIKLENLKLQGTK